MAGIVAVFLLVGAWGLSGSPSTAERTEDALDLMWADMDDRERLGFCAEVRLTGHTASAAQFMEAESDFDERTVLRWLLDRCS